MFNCREKCSDCCGVVPIPKEVYKKHIDKTAKSTKMIAEDSEYYYASNGDGIMCNFLDEENHKCKIYEDRPEVCRLYGINLELPCPFMKPNGNPRSEAQSKRVQRQINRNVDEVMKRKNV